METGDLPRTGHTFSYFHGGMYIDIHSHRAGAVGPQVIQNSLGHYEAIPPDGWYSAGIHPWYISGDGHHQLAALAACLSLPNVLAIGECGLDRLCTTPFAIQESVFREQIRLAKAHCKPLVIHCVKAWDETIQCLREEHTLVPVIFHGFRKSLPLAERLIREGYYLSFGEAVVQARMQRILQQVPLSQVFLETDDSLMEISALYEIAAGALGIGVNSLSLQLQKNAEKVFGFSLIDV